MKSNICSACGADNVIWDRKKLLCPKCWQRQYDPPKVECSACGNITKVVEHVESGPICNKCHNRLHKDIGTCSRCKEIKTLHKKTDDGGKICQKCYNLTREQELCVHCGNLTLPIKRLKKGEPVCKQCWHELYQPKEICTDCRQLKPICNKKEKLCQACHVRKRRQTDEKFHLTCTLRSRLKSAFKNNGLSKDKKSKEYNIDYNKIIQHLGPCPGPRNEYEVDHIFPLILFDFTNPKEIEAAFAPENHQWLLKTENRKKGDRCNIQDFKKYLEEFLERLSLDV